MTWRADPVPASICWMRCYGSGLCQVSNALPQWALGLGMPDRRLGALALTGSSTSPEAGMMGSARQMILATALLEDITARGSLRHGSSTRSQLGCGQATVDRAAACAAADLRGHSAGTEWCVGATDALAALKVGGSCAPVSTPGARRWGRGASALSDRWRPRRSDEGAVCVVERGQGSPTPDPSATVARELRDIRRAALRFLSVAQ